MTQDTNFSNHYIADEGKILQNKNNLDITTTSLWLSTNDSIDNYQEINEPIEEESETNTITTIVSDAQNT